MELRLPHIIRLYNVFLEYDGSENCAQLIEEEFNKTLGGNLVLEAMLVDHDEPMNYEEAMMSPDSAKWLEAMKSEMGSMYENDVYYTTFFL